MTRHLLPFKGQAGQAGGRAVKDLHGPAGRGRTGAGGPGAANVGIPYNGGATDVRITDRWLRPRRQLVTRRCHVCEWQDERIESAEASTDCPWCHAPSRVLRAVPLAERRRPLGVSVHAAALGRRGGLEGGTRAGGGTARANAGARSRRWRPARGGAGARSARAARRPDPRGGGGLRPRVERGAARDSAPWARAPLRCAGAGCTSPCGRARGGAGLDLAAVRGHRQVGDGDVLGLAGAVAHHAGVARAPARATQSRVSRQGADLVDLDQHRVARPLPRCRGPGSRGWSRRGRRPRAGPSSPSASVSSFQPGPVVLAQPSSIETIG